MADTSTQTALLTEAQKDSKRAFIEAAEKAGNIPADGPVRYMFNKHVNNLHFDSLFHPETGAPNLERHKNLTLAEFLETEQPTFKGLGKSFQTKALLSTIRIEGAPHEPINFSREETGRRYEPDATKTPPTAAQPPQHEPVPPKAEIPKTEIPKSETNNAWREKFGAYKERFGAHVNQKLHTEHGKMKFARQTAVGLGIAFVGNGLFSQVFPIKRPVIKDGELTNDTSQSRRQGLAEIAAGLALIGAGLA